MPLTVETGNVALDNGRVVIVLKVPKGIDKPYFDTEDSGPLPKIFDAMAFVKCNLHKIQAGSGVDLPGTPEIPEAIFDVLVDKSF